MTIIIGFILLSAVTFFLYATVTDSSKSKKEPKSAWFYIKMILWFLAILTVFHFPLFFAFVLFESIIVWIKMLFIK